MNKALYPKWTVLTNKDNSYWVGTQWEFFNDEEEATQCCLEHNKTENCLSTKRPFHTNDIKHLGAAHQWAIEHHQSQDKE